MTRHENLCPFCGAYSARSCELEEEAGGACPWEEADGELDPDRLREDQQDRQRLIDEEGWPE